MRAQRIIFDVVTTSSIACNLLQSSKPALTVSCP
jgi:hypothetical protein